MHLIKGYTNKLFCVQSLNSRVRKEIRESVCFVIIIIGNGMNHGICLRQPSETASKRVGNEAYLIPV